MSKESSFALFTYATGEAGRTLQIGYALWSRVHRFVVVSILDEPVWLQASEYALIMFTKEKIELWVKYGKLPYLEGTSLTPLDDAWWAHVRKLLVHQTRLSETILV